MPVPRAVVNAREQGELRLDWPDGHQVLSHARLRAACPCSRCRAARIRGQISVVTQDVRIERIELQGYGVQLVFSDGHDRGVFPWSYLKTLSA
ncbi:TPA: gamma-butyrobetaine hydroxylase-like domain-containing protein [Pseudomonas putida]|nr:DUF971 domain-containing protein [Pseudomonas putida]